MNCLFEYFDTFCHKSFGKIFLFALSVEKKGEDKESPDAHYYFHYCQVPMDWLTKLNFRFWEVPYN